MLASKLFFTLAALMASIVAISNFLVQFPVNYYGLENIFPGKSFIQDI